MIFIEDYIKDGGKIFISPQQENQILIKARFHGVEHMVSTQKGIRYLLALLEQKIAGNEELLEALEKKFPYGLSWQNLTPLDRLLNKTTVHIYAHDGEIIVDLYQVHASERDMSPGIQWCRVSSKRKRILELLEEEAKTFETIEFPKQVKKLELNY